MFHKQKVSDRDGAGAGAATRATMDLSIRGGRACGATRTAASAVWLRCRKASKSPLGRARTWHKRRRTACVRSPRTLLRSRLRTQTEDRGTRAHLPVANAKGCGKADPPHRRRCFELELESSASSASASSATNGVGAARKSRAAALHLASLRSACACQIWRDGQQSSAESFSEPCCCATTRRARPWLHRALRLAPLLPACVPLQQHGDARGLRHTSKSTAAKNVDATCAALVSPLARIATQRQCARGWLHPGPTRPSFVCVWRSVCSGVCSGACSGACSALVCACPYLSWF